MPDRQAILAAIHSAVDEVNEARPPEARLGKAPETPLFGEASILDSLGVVNLIVAVERELDDRLGAALTLADERAMSMRRSPFRTIETLAEYIEGRLREDGHDG